MVSFRQYYYETGLSWAQRNKEIQNAQTCFKQNN